MMNKQTEAEANIKKIQHQRRRSWSSRIEVQSSNGTLRSITSVHIFTSSQSSSSSFSLFFSKKSWGFWEHCLSVHGFVCRCPCASMFCTVFVFTTPRVCLYLYGWTPLKMRWEKKWRLISFIAVTNTKPPQPVGGLSHVWLCSVRYFSNGKCNAQTPVVCAFHWTQSQQTEAIMILHHRGRCALCEDVLASSSGVLVCDVKLLKMSTQFLQVPVESLALAEKLNSICSLFHFELPPAACAFNPWLT